MIACVDRWRERFVAELDRGAKRRLAEAVQRFVSAAKQYNMAEWSHAVEGASRRGALLISGDLGTVIADITDADERIELIAYSVSELHFELRRRIGVAAMA